MRLENLCGCKKQVRIAANIRDAVGRQVIKPLISCDQFWIADAIAAEDSAIELLALTGIGVELCGFKVSGHGALPRWRSLFYWLRGVSPQDSIDVDFFGSNKVGKGAL